jgi:autotransporter passenger strand-loop-strand repeat protein
MTVSTTILSGSAVSSAAVSSGQDLFVSGLAYATIVQGGGLLQTMGTGIASGTVVRSGGTEWAFGGVLSGSTIEAGGVQSVGPYGFAGNATVESGGTQVVTGSAIGSTVEGGGTLTVAFGYDDPESPYLAGGGVTSATVSSGGLMLLGGTATDTVVRNGGTAVALGPILVEETLGQATLQALVSDSTVDPGGLLIAPAAIVGGSTTGAITSTGVVLIESATGVRWFASAAAGLTAGGTGVDPRNPPFDTATLMVLASGTASGDSIGESASGVVYAGGAASGMAVGTGGALTVFSGGTLHDAMVDAGGSLGLFTGAVVSGGITFLGSGGTLVLQMQGGGLALNDATISGLVVGDSIEVVGLAESAITSVATVSSGNVLSLAGVSGGATLHFDSTQDFSGLAFAESTVLPMGPISAFLTLEPLSEIACFRAGTRIRAERGEVTVEALRVGEAVALAGGGFAPVRWLGHRRVACVRHPRPWDVWPVRIAAGAFAPEMPRRELYLSPDHAVLVGGVLIPVRYLVNGATVAPVEVDEVTYWHVELPAHGMLLAEGMACESFLDTGNRGAFADGGESIQLHPDFARAAWAARGCAPLVLDGPPVTRARRRLLARAGQLGFRLTSVPALAALSNGAPVPVAADGAVRRVRLPEGAETLRLVSRTWVPAQIDAEAGDTRTLGVAVGRIWLDGRAASLDSPALAEGWHAPEPAGRWTNGDASVAVRGVRELAFRVAMTGKYWQAAQPLAASSSLNVSMAALKASRPAGTPA